MRLLTLCIFGFLFIACTKENPVVKEPVSFKGELVGAWRGYQQIWYNADGSVQTIWDAPPYNIIFAYDNGIQFKEDGSVVGLIADNPADPDTEFKPYEPYTGSWQYNSTDNILMMDGEWPDLKFKIEYLAEDELYISRDDVNDTRLVIKFRR